MENKYRLFVDEDTQDKSLVQTFRSKGFDVVTVNEAGLAGEEDPVILQAAHADKRPLLTSNPDDFVELNKVQQHSGIMPIHQQHGKPLTYMQIVSGVTNIVRFCNHTGLSMENKVFPVRDYLQLELPGMDADED